MTRHYPSPSMWAHLEDVNEVMAGTPAQPYPYYDRLVPGTTWLDATGWGRKILGVVGEIVTYEKFPERSVRNCSVSTFLRWQDRHENRLAVFDEMQALARISGIPRSLIGLAEPNPMPRGQLKLPF